MIQSTDTAAWKDTRVGRFTASTFGTLMVEPRSKADKEAGKFSEAGRSLITAKAIERLTGQWMNDVDTAPMRRGLLLEPAAIHILSEAWTPLFACTWQPYGDNFGSTPDALLADGSPMDLKCPGNPAEVVRFADEVPDGDFDALVSWDRNYAWQIMVQAITCGANRAHLVYFTDRLSIIKLTDQQRHEAQSLIDHRAELHSQESFYPWSYTLASDGYFYTRRTFTLSDERRALILATRDRAEAECLRVMDRLRPILGIQPTQPQDQP